jgi:hypothetical protein
MDPNVFKLTEVIHTERLQQAANQRRFRKFATRKLSLRQYLLLHPGNLLISLGQWLQARPQSKVAPVTISQR